VTFEEKEEILPPILKIPVFGAGMTALAEWYNFYANKEKVL
jgi:hypothetical protein